MSPPIAISRETVLRDPAARGASAERFRNSSGQRTRTDAGDCDGRLTISHDMANMLLVLLLDAIQGRGRAGRGMGDQRDEEPWGVPPPDPRWPERTLAVITLLLGFLLDLRRGRREFLRAYGLSGDSVEDGGDPEKLAQSLLEEGKDGDTERLLQRWMSELMLHQAALLEGHQAAIQAGTLDLLRQLDPAALAESVRRSGVRLGPIALATHSGPLLQQAVWEEFLRRFRDLRQLDPAEYERFFRDGYRRGYAAFHGTRGVGLGGAEVPSVAEEGGTR
jgi:hypothetical protein